MDAPWNPWAGTCGDPDSPTFGKAENAFTSGFEGPWTQTPTVRWPVFWWDPGCFKPAYGLRVHQNKTYSVCAITFVSYV